MARLILYLVSIHFAFCVDVYVQNMLFSYTLKISSICSDSVMAIGIGACRKQKSDRENGPPKPRVYDDGPPSDFEAGAGFIFTAVESGEATLSPTGAVAPTEERTVSQPVVPGSTSTNAPDGPVATKSPVTGSPVVAPVTRAPVAVSPSPIIAPVTRAPVETPVAAPVETPATDSPIDTPVTEAPFDPPTTGPLTLSPVEAPVDTLVTGSPTITPVVTTSPRADRIFVRAYPVQFSGDSFAEIDQGFEDACLAFFQQQLTDTTSIETCTLEKRDLLGQRRLQASQSRLEVIIGITGSTTSNGIDPNAFASALVLIVNQNMLDFITALQTVDNAENQIFYTSVTVVEACLVDGNIPDETCPAFLDAPSIKPSTLPSAAPAMEHSDAPSAQPSGAPSRMPSTMEPSQSLSTKPSTILSTVPTVQHSDVPSIEPRSLPSIEPSQLPTSEPSAMPSNVPTVLQSNVPSIKPSNLPSLLPTIKLSGLPSSEPSILPSDVPTVLHSDVPSIKPSKLPSSRPSTDAK